AWLRYRDKMLHRYEELLALKSIDERLLDESMERYEAALESSRAADEAIFAAHAKETATEARIDGADADILEATAQVSVAEAELKKSQAMVDFATICAPFDGVVSQRSVYVKHFIRSATINSTQAPLLTVERTDKIRIVVMIPDRDIPFTDVGDE